eukprot:GEMP01000078.1.p1 GENE.GEMP01000078.1~~GEMP01000078.1.p1  ORF type:complete len:2844 (+),score=731.29 GEMP01000078.1:354-8534(+)
MTIVVETFSATFPKRLSPFQDAQFINTQLRQVPETYGEDALRFADEYGNSIISKGYGGGALRVTFKKSIQQGLGLPQVKIDGQVYTMEVVENGGRLPFLKTEKPLAPNDLEKVIKLWEKSIRGKQSPAIVRVELERFSKLVGVTAPSALATMDEAKFLAWSEIRNDLKIARRKKQLDDFRDALTEAKRVGLDDPEVESSLTDLKKMDEALSALASATRREDVDALSSALELAYAAELNAWAPKELEAAQSLLMELDENIQHSILTRARTVPELIGAVKDAVEKSFSKLPEFKEASNRLSDGIHDSTTVLRESGRFMPPNEPRDVAGRKLSPDELYELMLAVPDIPQLNSVLMAVKVYKAALEERKEWDAIAADVRAAVDAKDIAALRDLEAQMEMKEFMDRGVKEEARAMLDMHRANVQMTENVEKTLQSAMDGNSIGSLENALLEVDAKSKSLTARPVDSSLVSNARKQLAKLFHAELQKHMADRHLSACDNILKRMQVCNENMTDTQSKVDALRREVETDEQTEEARRGAAENLRTALTQGDPDLLRSAIKRAKDNRVSADYANAEAQLRELQDAQDGLLHCMGKDRIALAYALEKAQAAGLNTPTLTEAMAKLSKEKTAKLLHAIGTRDLGLLKHHLEQARQLPKEEQEEIRDVITQAEKVEGELEAVLQRTRVALNGLNYGDLRKALEAARADPSLMTHREVQKAERVLSEMDRCLHRLKGADAQEDLSSALKLGREYELMNTKEYIDAYAKFSKMVLPQGSGGDKAVADIWVNSCSDTGIFGPQPLDELIFRLCKEHLPDPVDNRTLNYLRTVFALLCRKGPLLAVLEEALIRTEKKDAVTQEEFATVGRMCKESEVSFGDLIWWCFCIVEAESSLRLFHSFLSQLQVRWQEVLHECTSSIRALKNHTTTLDVASPDTNVKGQSRSTSLQFIIEDVVKLREECEKMEAQVLAEPRDATLDLPMCRANALSRVPPSHKFTARRQLMASQYSILEGKMLALHEAGKMAIEGDMRSTSLDLFTIKPTPIGGAEMFKTMYGREMGTDIADKTFLLLLGVKHPPTFLDTNYVFRKVEVFNMNIKKNEPIEDEFERISNRVVAQARQRCSGGMVVALRALLVDLLKRRQRLATVLNSLKIHYEADQRERMLLRKHLQSRDLLIALIMTTAPSCAAKILMLAAQADSVLPFLFSTLGLKNTLQTTLPWLAYTEVLNGPQPPLVLNVGSNSTAGKSYMLQYLYALAEVHLQSNAKPPLVCHSTTNIDLILDMTRETALREITLADVHCWSADDELSVNALMTLNSFSALTFLHVSYKTYNENELQPMLHALSSSRGNKKVPIVIFLRDLSIDDIDAQEHKRYTEIQNSLKAWATEHCDLQGIFAVPPLNETNNLAGEMKTLRKSRPLVGGTKDLETLLTEATKRDALPVLSSIQERFAIIQKRQAIIVSSKDRLISPIGVAEKSLLSSVEGSLFEKVFPLTYCNQKLVALLKEKAYNQRKTKEYMEPDQRIELERTLDQLDQNIQRYRKMRRQAHVHPLSEMFADIIMNKPAVVQEFGCYLQLWKKEKTAPLAQEKLKLRRLLDSTKDDPKKANESEKHMKQIGAIQKELDSFDVSLDSFWHEFMVMAECQRAGSWKGKINNLSREMLIKCFVKWVKGGNPLHFLHSSPLQFGAFEPMRWHPHIVGSPLFGTDFIGDVLREFDHEFKVDRVNKPLVVISVIGVQSSGKSTLLNYLFGCSFVTHAGRCTRGLYISLLETADQVVLILDTEGLLSVEARDDVFDKQVALMTMACSHLVIVNNRGELGRHVGDLFQVCLFALYHLNLAKIAPAIGFVLQCLSMVNEGQQYEWVSTVKKSLEESVEELQKQESGTFHLKDLVHLDSDSIFIMPSAFNDDVQYGVQVSRPTSLYALEALNLRQTVFKWIDKARLGQVQAAQDASFGSLSQWYDHARMVWQNLEMCGTDLLQFRTMRQVLLAQQLEEFCSALVQKHVDEGMSKAADAMIERYNKELHEAPSANVVKVIDNKFVVEFDLLRQTTVREMNDEFERFVKQHDKKFTDKQINNDKKYGLMGAVRRLVSRVEAYWRSCQNLALERVSMDSLFDEISGKVNRLLKEQGGAVNVSNVEKIFHEKWNEVVGEITKKQWPNLDKVVMDTIQTYNAALLSLKSQFRKTHGFHSVKQLTPNDLGFVGKDDFVSLLTEKKVGLIFIPSRRGDVKNTPAQNNMDAVWFKIVDGIRFEVNKSGALSDAKTLKVLTNLNQDLECSEPLKKVMADMGSPFLQKVYTELAKATVQCIFQWEQNRFEQRLAEVEDKKMQKLWELQANLDQAKREVHCAKVWAKKLYDGLNKEFKLTARRMSKEIVSKIQNIMTNPAQACDLAIERSFTKRNWHHVVMYCIDPTQYLYREFHQEWESFQSSLLNQYSQELQHDFGECLRILEAKLRELGPKSGSSLNDISDHLRSMVDQMHQESLRKALLAILPTFQSEENWVLNNTTTFCEFAQLELSKYRSQCDDAGKADMETLMMRELAAQKCEVWQMITGCAARCPGCGTKCNCESEDHWPAKPHECRRHLYPAFNGWQRADDRKPFLFHCRSPMQWRIARTRPPLEAGGRIRKWGDFKSMLRDEHPDWLDPATKEPMQSMAPNAEYDENATEQGELVAKEIEENRRAWANCRIALMQHYTTMADDTRMAWLSKYFNAKGALKESDFAQIFDELFEVTPGADAQRTQGGK